jgi:hypothetical protein
MSAPLPRTVKIGNEQVDTSLLSPTRFFIYYAENPDVRKLCAHHRTLAKGGRGCQFGTRCNFAHAKAYDVNGKVSHDPDYDLKRMEAVAASKKRAKAAGPAAAQTNGNKASSFDIVDNGDDEEYFDEEEDGYDDEDDDHEQYGNSHQQHAACAPAASGGASTIPGKNQTSAPLPRTVKISGKEIDTSLLLPTKFFSFYASRPDAAQLCMHHRTILTGGRGCVHGANCQFAHAKAYDVNGKISRNPDDLKRMEAVAASKKGGAGAGPATAKTNGNNPASYDGDDGDDEEYFDQEASYEEEDEDDDRDQYGNSHQQHAGSTSSGASPVPAHELSRPASIYNFVLLRLRQRERLLGQVPSIQIGSDWGFIGSTFSDATRDSITWRDCFGVLLDNGWAEMVPGRGSVPNVRVCQRGEEQLQRVYAKFPALLALPKHFPALNEFARQVLDATRGVPGAPASARAAASSGTGAAAASNGALRAPAPASCAAAVAGAAHGNYAFADATLLRMLQRQVQSDEDRVQSITFAIDAAYLRHRFTGPDSITVQRGFHELAVDRGWMTINDKLAAHVSITTAGVAHLRGVFPAQALASVLHRTTDGSVPSLVSFLTALGVRNVTAQPAHSPHDCFLLRTFQLQVNSKTGKVVTPGAANEYASLRTYFGGETMPPHRDVVHKLDQLGYTEYESNRGKFCVSDAGIAHLTKVFGQPLMDAIRKMNTLPPVAEFVDLICTAPAKAPAVAAASSAPAAASTATAIRSAPVVAAGRPALPTVGSNDNDGDDDAAVGPTAIAALPFSFDDVVFLRVLQHQLQTPAGSKTLVLPLATKDLPMLTQLFTESGRRDARPLRQFARPAETRGWLERSATHIEMTPRGIEHIKSVFFNDASVLHKPPSLPSIPAFLEDVARIAASKRKSGDVSSSSSAATHGQRPGAPAAASSPSGVAAGAVASAVAAHAALPAAGSNVNDGDDDGDDRADYASTDGAQLASQPEHQHQPAQFAAAQAQQPHADVPHTTAPEHEQQYQQMVHDLQRSLSAAQVQYESESQRAHAAYVDLAAAMQVISSKNEVLASAYAASAGKEAEIASLRAALRARDQRIAAFEAELVKLKSASQ